ncbi:hypothetical protein MMC13_005522 [Lambiella insularis]|nr:hypothetical protein [Lambiella insularis]
MSGLNSIDNFEAEDEMDNTITVEQPPTKQTTKPGATEERKRAESKMDKSEVPNWAVGDSQHRRNARRILEEPDTVYPLGSGCTQCLKRERVCLFRNGLAKCASCTSLTYTQCIIDTGTSGSKGRTTADRTKTKATSTVNILPVPRTTKKHGTGALKPSSSVPSCGGISTASLALPVDVYAHDQDHDIDVALAVGRKQVAKQRPVDEEFDLEEDFDPPGRLRFETLEECPEDNETPIAPQLQQSSLTTRKAVYKHHYSEEDQPRKKQKRNHSADDYTPSPLSCGIRDHEGFSVPVQQSEPKVGQNASQQRGPIDFEQLQTSGSTSQEDPAAATTSAQCSIFRESSASLSTTVIRDEPQSSEGVKTRVEVDFWIITSHQPRLARDHWREGMLSGKNLNFFIEAATKATKNVRIRELKCTLKTAETEISFTVHKDDEEGFESMKSTFSKEIKRAWAKDGNNKENFEVWIDPVVEESTLANGQGAMEEIELADF